MSKKIRLIALLVILVTTLVVNVAQAREAVAVETATPCTDAWENCVNSGNYTAEQCHMWWCGCMYGKYGYVCPETA